MTEAPFEQAAFVDFFEHHRNHPDDLYPSERRFLPELAAGAGRVLDVGSAAGGFFPIWRAYNPTIRYVGVDISHRLVESARRRYPQATFFQADATLGIRVPDRSVDVVAALGWLHWEPEWRTVLRELWRIAAGSLFFDVRLHSGQGELRGVQTLPGGGETRYLCFSADDFLSFLVDALAPSTIRAYGYLSSPAATVRGMPTELCTATFVLDREPSARGSSLELPLDIAA